MTAGAPSIKQHPYVVRTSGTCGGRARIDGTRIAVWLIAGAVVHGGETPEDLVAAYPQLSLAQIYDALSYYYDHRDEIERDLADQEAAWPE